MLNDKSRRSNSSLRAVNFDYLPLLILLLLLLFGLLIVYDSSSAQALISFKDKFYFLKEQAKWIIIGLAAATGAFLFDYRQLRQLALPILLTALALLLAVFVPGLGIEAYGAHRWINLGFTVLQPSEFAKLALIIYLSAWLVNREKGRLLSFLILIAALVGLIVLEPDMGTAIVLFGASIVIYFLSDSELRSLLLVIPLSIVAAVALAINSPYRLRRLLTFLDPESDPLGSSYHVRQALIAFGSGGLFGIGFGNSRQKYSYLPEANTDSIFAIVGEELGFIGSALIVAGIAFFLYRLFKTTILVEDKFGRLLGMGIISWVALQTVINIGSMVALMPLTGVPLPFISYGGSALVVELVGMGILFNIWKVNQRKQ